MLFNRNIPDKFKIRYNNILIQIAELEKKDRRCIEDNFENILNNESDLLCKSSKISSELVNEIQDFGKTLMSSDRIDIMKYIVKNISVSILGAMFVFGITKKATQDDRVMIQSLIHSLGNKKKSKSNFESLTNTLMHIFVWQPLIVNVSKPVQDWINTLFGKKITDKVKYPFEPFIKQLNEKLDMQNEVGKKLIR